MISGPKRENRQIIPRWHPFEIAAELQETVPLEIYTSPKFSFQDEYLEKQRQWIKYQQLPFALELVATALIINDLDNDVVNKAADFVVGNKELIPKLTTSIAESYITASARFKITGMPLTATSPDSRREKVESTIQKLKKHVRKYPNNPICWLDLAYWYSVLGQPQKASKCILISGNLAKGNRFITRSSARFYLHNGDPEQALHTLRVSGLNKHDPWLLASEISISEAFDIPSPLKLYGKSLVSKDSYRPRDLAELAGTIATLEAKNGNMKRAKKFFGKALTNPNENTVAQAEWAAAKLGFKIRQVSDRIVPATYEAEVIKLFRNGEYTKCVESADKWVRYEPYRAAPAIFGSYVASIGLRNEKLAIKLIELALPSSPGNFILSSNYAYSLATDGQIEKAKTVLQKLSRMHFDEGEAAIYRANQGLIAFRQGDHLKGRQCYRDAVKIFKSQKSKSMIARATIIWAREELLACTEYAQELKANSIQLAKRENDKEMTVFAQAL